MWRYLLATSLLWLALLVALGEAPAGSNKVKKVAGILKANDGVITHWGKPKALEAGRFHAYWLWYDDGVWHFRTTGGGKGAPLFSGQIDVVGGRLIGLKGKKGEFAGKNVDKFIINPARTAIAFSFKTDEGIDGLSFAVEPAATALRFSLAINGDAAPKHIRIGRDSDHPAAAVFTVPAHPFDLPGGKKKGKKK